MFSRRLVDVVCSKTTTAATTTTATTITTTTTTKNVKKYAEYITKLKFNLFQNTEFDNEKLN